jgi:hypothetical protein
VWHRGLTDILPTKTQNIVIAAIVIAGGIGLLVVIERPVFAERR